MLTALILILTTLLTLTQPYLCQSQQPPSWECALNGYLDPTGHKCICYQGWTGTSCGRLNLGVVGSSLSNFTPAYGYDNSTSWGGNVIFWNNEIHFFVDGMKNDCGLHTWRSNSQIVHTISRSGAISGPYVKLDIALVPWAHNAAPLKINGSIYLFHIGAANSTGPFANCTKSDTTTTTTTTTTKTPPSSTAAPSSPFVHRASQPTGPWIPLPIMSGLSECDNPAPFVHPNQTLFCGCAHGSSVEIYRCNNIETGDWTPISLISPPF